MLTLPDAPQHPGTSIDCYMSLTLFKVEQSPKAKLKEHLRHLANEIFPEIAAREGYPITENHCLLRVVYDQLFQGKWQDQISINGPLINSLTEKQLIQAIQLAALVISDKSTCQKMNAQSLEWRA